MNTSIRETLLGLLGGGATLSLNELAAQAGLPAGELRAPLDALCAEGCLLYTSGCFSRTATRSRPGSASAHAAARPEAPPPTISTSYIRRFLPDTL